MLACTLVHEGVENLSLSRIQVSQNSFGGYPEDLRIAFCRQCVKPSCVEACPTGACHVDAANHNVRVINISLCNGCQKCLEACHFHLAIWDAQRRLALKCDLCLYASYWSEIGKQACIEVCPVKAIKLEHKTAPTLEKIKED